MSKKTEGAIHVLDCALQDDKKPASGSNDFNVLLVSEASGQMELKHRLRMRAFKVMGRTVSIFQFQLRRKMLKILRLWKGSGSSGREFAFVHLLLNLKERPKTPRVPSEYIPALERIRTDLDQFSFIKREALMYHGYTLIDAQIRDHCPSLKTLIHDDEPKLRQPPLFRDRPSSGRIDEECVSETRLRKRVKDVLEAGSGSIFLCRSWQKYPKKSWLVFGPALSFILAGWWAGRYYYESIYAGISQVEGWLSRVVPDWVRTILEILVGSSDFPMDTHVVGTVKEPTVHWT